MRRHRFILLGSAVLLFLCLCGGLAVGASFFLGSRYPCSRGNGTFGSDVTVAQNQQVDSVRACGSNVVVLGHVSGDVSAYGGNVKIAPTGDVDGDIASYGGSVEIGGMVGGNVSSYGGGITLDSNANVVGDVSSYGGGITKVPGARVQGNIEENHTDVSLTSLPFFNPLGFTFPLLSLGIWMLVAATLAHWMPQRTLRVGEVMFSALPRSLAVGVLSWVLGLILAVILAFTIIGLPVTLAILLVLVIGDVLGNVAIGWLIGRILLHHVVRIHASPVLAAVVGIAILILIESIPFVGVILNVLIAMLGVGATLLSRFGSRRWRTSLFRRSVA
jgi:cytoskeletal protein CcmA (bactofilin family)